MSNIIYPTSADICEEAIVDERPCDRCNVRAGIRIDLCSVGYCVRQDIKDLEDENSGGSR